MQTDNHQSTAEGFLSSDPDRIRTASFRILRSWDRQDLLALADLILPNLRARPAIDLGGAIIPNSHWVDLAAEKLRLARTDGCLCRIVGHSQHLDPKRLEGEGAVVILRQWSDPVDWADFVDCRCAVCQTPYDVRIELGWHVPWYQWTRGTAARPDRSAPAADGRHDIGTGCPDSRTGPGRSCDALPHRGTAGSAPYRRA